jgi:hypothetical protein
MFESQSSHLSNLRMKITNITNCNVGVWSKASLCRHSTTCVCGGNHGFVFEHRFKSPESCYMCSSICPTFTACVSPFVLCVCELKFFVGILGFAIQEFSIGILSSLLILWFATYFLSCLATRHLTLCQCFIPRRIDVILQNYDHPS